MFLAAAPYFQRRFESSPWVVSHFQSSILSVSCATNLCSVIIFTKRQKSASYPRRVLLSLLLNIVAFTLLAFSTILFRNIPVGVYFAFVLVMVFGASLATGMNQNGIFAYVSGFGRNEYTQAIMAGQGVAGVMPCIAQILSVLAVSEQGNPGGETTQYQSSKSAFAYFSTATGVSMSAFLAFVYLLRRHNELSSPFKTAEEALPISEEEEEALDAPVKKQISLWTLFRKLQWMSLAVYLCFAITMVYPVFTTEIQSVRDTTPLPRLFQPAIFIPLALLFWNTGDLLGRVILVFPKLNLTHYPRVLFAISVCRLVFIPLYMSCNVNGRGAMVNSDSFYLIVQLLFGITNGYVGSSAMMGAGEWVSVEEREAAGAFMGLMLVAGLSTGSFLSFFVSSL